MYSALNSFPYNINVFKNSNCQLKHDTFLEIFINSLLIMSVFDTIE